MVLYIVPPNVREQYSTLALAFLLFKIVPHLSASSTHFAGICQHAPAGVSIISCMLCLDEKELSASRMVLAIATALLYE